MNEPPPDKLCDQDPDALLDIRLRQDPPLRRLATLIPVLGATSEESARLIQEWGGISTVPQYFEAGKEARVKAESAWRAKKEAATVPWEEARRAQQVASDTLRRTKEEIRYLEGPPVIPDDDRDSSRVTLSLEQFEDSQTPFEDSQIPE